MIFWKCYIHIPIHFSLQPIQNKFWIGDEQSYQLLKAEQKMSKTK